MNGASNPTLQTFELRSHLLLALFSRSIKAAITRGGRGLVDGIIILAEHGDYPYTEDGQHVYPRRHIFEQACGVLAEAGAARPIFNDKHLS